MKTRNMEDHDLLTVKEALNKEILRLEEERTASVLHNLESKMERVQKEMDDLNRLRLVEVDRLSAIDKEIGELSRFLFKLKEISNDIDQEVEEDTDDSKEEDQEEAPEQLPEDVVEEE